MGSRSALRFDPNRQAIGEFLDQLQQMGKSERQVWNMVTRDLSSSAASSLVPIVQRGVRMSPAPQAAAVAATVRPKRDRMIVVVVGATNPRLSGWRRRAANKRYRGSIAWGVERGNFPGTRNEYGGIGRSAGYGVARVLPDLIDKAGQAYADIVLSVVSRSGWPVR